MLHLLSNFAKYIINKSKFNIVLMDAEQISIYELNRHINENPCNLFNINLIGNIISSSERANILKDATNNISKNIQINKNNDTIFILTGVFTNFLEIKYPIDIPFNKIEEYISWSMYKNLFIQNKNNIYTWQKIKNNKLLAGCINQEIIHDIKLFSNELFGNIHAIYTLPELYLNHIVSNVNEPSHVTIISLSSWTVITIETDTLYIKSYSSTNYVELGTTLASYLDYIQTCNSNTILNLSVLGEENISAYMIDFLKNSANITIQIDYINMENRYAAKMAVERFCR